MPNDEIKIRIHITKGSLVLAELHSLVDGGRHEFVFSQPIRTDAGRHFEGFAVECWLDQTARHLTNLRHDERPQLELPFQR